MFVHGANMGAWSESFRQKAAAGNLEVNDKANVELPKLVIGGGEVWQVHQDLDRWVSESLLQVAHYFRDVMQFVVGF